MDQEFVDSVRETLIKHQAKYHLVVLQTLGSSSRYRGEHHNLEYVTKIAKEILGDDYVLNAQVMFRCVADSLRVMPSGLVIPQGHGDINAISNLESLFGGSLPDTPIFHAMKHAGDFCNEDGSLINPYMKTEKDELVQKAYRDWLLNSVKPNPLDVSEL